MYTEGDDPTFEQWLRAQIKREMDLAYDCIDHERLWGVPCGPTLSMIPVAERNRIFVETWSPPRR